MLYNTVIFALSLSSLVSAHGKIAVIHGDAGGNTTGLAIRGGIVPGAGPNSKTEVDTTVFSSTKIESDGLGRTTGSGKNKVDMVKQAMALSGNTLPQVSATNGTLSGVFHIVTTDGAGPVQAVVDPTGTGAFSKGVVLTTIKQVPGTNGNIKAPKQEKQQKQQRAIEMLMKLFGRGGAKNVNQDFPVEFAVPAGLTCTGTVNGVQNVCLAKIANSNKAGPFGGVVAFQIAKPAAKREAVFVA